MISIKIQSKKEATLFEKTRHPPFLKRGFSETRFGHHRSIRGYLQNTTGLGEPADGGIVFQGPVTGTEPELDRKLYSFQMVVQK